MLVQPDDKYLILILLVLCHVTTSIIVSIIFQPQNKIIPHQ